MTLAEENVPVAGSDYESDDEFDNLLRQKKREQEAMIMTEDDFDIESMIALDVERPQTESQTLKRPLDVGSSKSFSSKFQKISEMPSSETSSSSAFSFDYSRVFGQAKEFLQHIFEKKEKFLWKGIEHIDKRKLQHLVAHYDALVPSKKIHSSTPPEEVLQIREKEKGQKTSLENYLRSTAGDTHEAIFKHNNETMGRMIAPLSLASIKKCVRHTIAGDFYYDIDMVNAHPELLRFYCVSNKWECPLLTKYCNNRVELLNDFIEKVPNSNRDDAKTAFLRVINGGKLRVNEDKCESLVSFSQEMERIRIFIAGTRPDLLPIALANAKKKLPPNSTGKGNWEGSLINLLLCEYENKVLMHMIAFSLKHLVSRLIR
eukprot:Pompholyxophrys_punicea_v1_NODE_514_length_1789_cov_2.587082.p1 type:complete len:374 gc:universal NODE_514_length_1789_cov_2.587082:1410-289(-)